MKKLVVLIVLLIAAAGFAFFQTSAPPPQLAAWMPGGALLYLEAPDFGRLLREWDSSQVKAEWLQSANYQVFSRSNLFDKLGEVYGQYGAAAGFSPDLKTLIEMAGTDSALALYDIHEVQFLYVSRIAEADLAKSSLWAVRAGFQQRQAGGVPFYLRVDPASKRTVAFAVTRGYLLLATRDDLVAQSLELFAGTANPSIASDRWYREAAAQAPDRGELQLVTNLQSLVQSDYFRSYWIQRNASAVRRYWAGVSDIKRAGGAITETRVFLRAPEIAAGGSPMVANLLALAPPDAGMYKAEPLTSASAAAALVVDKLIGTPPAPSRDERDAPFAVSPDDRAGTEGDLETRIDEQPLPPDAGISDSVAAARTLIEKAAPGAMLLVQSSVLDNGTFVRTPAALVLESAVDWDPAAVRSALGSAAGKLWTTSQMGAAWVPTTMGRHSIERLDGLGSVAFAIRGHRLFLANDTRLLASLLDRDGAAPSNTALTYAAGFRHLRERPNFERIMTALDFSGPAAGTAIFGIQAEGRPSFFSGNVASLSRVLSKVSEVRVTEQDKGPVTTETVVYRVEP